MSRVQKMVHLARRYDDYDQEHQKTVLVRAGRRAYESELGSLAARAGCPGRSGQLTNGTMLSELNEIYEQHATSIVNTYNYDLALQIKALYEQNHRGNRYYYAYHLRTWHKVRSEMKETQIAQMTDGVARALAQQHFFQMNGSLQCVATLEPTTAVCPVCQGWIARGEVPVQEVMNHPPPYHVNCVHRWRVQRSEALPASSCELLWMGE
jgi:hypothetical protein